MKTILLLSLLTPLSTPSAHATGQQAHVVQLDGDFPVDALKGEGIETHSLAQRASETKMLLPEVQKVLFQEAGLLPYLEGWDELDQDRLALRAENQPPAEVAARYEGKIPVEKIAKLASLIRLYRQEKSRK